MVERNLDRRDFLKGTIAMPVVYSIVGCGGGSDSPRQENARFIPTPNVDYPPYKNLDYFMQSKKTRNWGEIVNFAGPIRGWRYSAMSSNVPRGDLNFNYYEGEGEDTLILVTDERREYLPSMRAYPQPRRANTNLAEDPQRAISLEDFGLKLKSEAMRYGNKYLDRLRFNLPAFNSVVSARTPQGMVYLGDWSFNKLKDVNNLVKDTSGVLAMVDSTGTSAGVYGVTSTSGKVFDGIDNVIDGVNNLFGAGINKDKYFSIYLPSGILGPINEIPLIIASEVLRSVNVGIPIEKLFPLQPGNSWTYRSNYGQVRMSVNRELANIRGKNLLVLKNEGGLEELLGFRGRELFYHGFRSNETGNVLFEPAVKLGDEGIRSGSLYQNNGSQIIAERFPEISGTINTYIIYNSQSDIELSNGDVYGGCIGQTENSNISMTNSSNGRSVSDTIHASREFAQNVGPVKIRIGGTNLELIEGTTSPSSALASHQEESPKSISREITRMIKSLK